jgi:RNA polymerase sigma-70 factor, ECF subfamily
MNSNEHWAASAGSPNVNLPDGERTQWLLQHEHGLRLLARLEINRRFAGKFDPSDVVQQTLLEAWQGWDGLKASDEPQRYAWLRQILVHQLAKFVRHHQATLKRDISRELAIDNVEHSVSASAQKLDRLLVAQDPSPSHVAIAQEQRELLARVLEELPEDYREVILLRSIEELSHQEVAQRMGRSEPAVRMLWLRALAALGAKLNVA